MNMELCRKLGLDKDNYSVSIPLGATINMAGAAVTISVMAMGGRPHHGRVHRSAHAVILSALAAVSACGASGVAGGSLLLIPLACSLFGIGNDVAMQVVAIGFIIGVVQDSCETALNSSSDVLFTATSEYREWRKAGKEITFGENAFSETSWRKGNGSSARRRAAPGPALLLARVAIGRPPSPYRRCRRR